MQEIQVVAIFDIGYDHNDMTCIIGTYNMLRDNLATTKEKTCV